MSDYSSEFLEALADYAETLQQRIEEAIDLAHEVSE